MRGISLVVALAVSALTFAGAADAAEIRVISPGVISNSGLTEVAAAFEKKTGVKVTIQVDWHGHDHERHPHQGRRRLMW